MPPGRHAHTLSVARDQPLYRQFLRVRSLSHDCSTHASYPGPLLHNHPDPPLASYPGPSLQNHPDPTHASYPGPSLQNHSDPPLASHPGPTLDEHPGFALPPSILPDVLLIRGSPSIAPGPRLGLVCSVRMKGALIVSMYDYATSLRPEDGVVVGGFHSPMERQVLERLLTRHVPVIVVPARNPERMRIPREWRAPMDEGRLTIVSGVGGATRRPTRELALRRNLLVAALADGVLIPYATPGGAAEAVARAVVQWSKPLWTFKDEANAGLFVVGAKEVGRRSYNGRPRNDFGA